jgi:hypothetical protein
MRNSFASRLLYFGIELFWRAPSWPNQQQIGPHALLYSVQPARAIAPSDTCSKERCCEQWGAEAEYSFLETVCDPTNDPASGCMKKGRNPGFRPRTSQIGCGGLQCTEDAFVLPFRYELTSQVAA